MPTICGQFKYTPACTILGLIVWPYMAFLIASNFCVLLHGLLQCILQENTYYRTMYKLVHCSIVHRSIVALFHFSSQVPQARPNKQLHVQRKKWHRKLQTSTLRSVCIPALSKHLLLPNPPSTSDPDQKTNCRANCWLGLVSLTKLEKQRESLLEVTSCLDLQQLGQLAHFCSIALSGWLDFTVECVSQM